MEAWSRQNACAWAEEPNTVVKQAAAAQRRALSLAAGASVGASSASRKRRRKRGLTARATISVNRNACGCGVWVYERGRGANTVSCGAHAVWAPSINSVADGSNMSHVDSALMQHRGQVRRGHDRRWALTQRGQEGRNGLLQAAGGGGRACVAGRRAVEGRYQLGDRGSEFVCGGGKEGRRTSGRS